MFKRTIFSFLNTSVTSRLIACCFAFILMIFVTGTFCTGEEKRGPEFSLDAGMDSDYVFKGHNILDSGKLASFGLNMEYDGFTAGVWYGVGTAQGYQEINLIAQYAHEFCGLDVYAGYTRLEFIEDDAYDNEIHAGMGRTFAFLTVGLDYIYSAENDGSIFEPYIQGEFTFCGERLSFEPYLRQGVDFGYVSSDHDQCNYLETGIKSAYALTDNFRLTARIAYSRSQKNIKDEGFGDFLWGGVGISVNF